MGGNRCFRRLRRCRPYLDDLFVVSVTVENLHKEKKKRNITVSAMIITCCHGDISLIMNNFELTELQDLFMVSDML